MITPPAAQRHPLDPGIPIAIVLAAISLTLSLLGAQQLEDLRVLRQSDVWFHADPGVYRWWFTEIPTVSVRHPLLPLLVNGTIAAASKILRFTGLGDGNEWLVRQWLVLLPVPVVNAARTALLFGVFRRLTNRLGPAVLLCVIDMASFTNVVFGSVPESYPFTAACIAWMLWTATTQADTQRIPYGRWTVLGTLAVGVTTTNVIPLAALLGTTMLRIRQPRWRAAAGTAVVSTIALLLNGAVVVVGSRLLPVDDSIKSTAASFHAPAMTEAKELAFAVGHTFVAPIPGTDPVAKSRAENPDYDFAFSYRHPYPHGVSSNWRAFVTAALVLLGMAGFRHDRNRTLLLLGAAATVIGNVAVSLVWGDHYILYSLHWSAALLVMISGSSSFQKAGARVGMALLAAFAVITVANSLVVWQYLIATLASA